MFRNPRHSLIALSFVFAAAATTAFAAGDPVTPLIDVPGSAWRQSPPIVSMMEKHSGDAPLRVTIHFTDEPKNFDKSLVAKLRTLYDYSIHTIEGTKKKLWGDIPYHYYIDANGKLGECRSPIYMPDSNTAYDRDGHITIVVEGNDKDGITAAQKSKLFALIAALQAKYHVPTGRVGVHKNYAETDCPGDAVTNAVASFKSAHPDIK